MALIIFAFLLNLFSLYLKFVFTQYIIVIEHYSMNEVELTNMLPHMKENLRNRLFHNASTALINAGIRLQHVNNDFDEQHFGLDTPDQIMKLFYSKNN
uniref:Uncharacterized protein n=1 Tax=Meloidogyne enterolobii TaxID=390850 RepID=A0A6V7UXD8_MELEN|nr:unnamed protein product [Meloidogyne enterolobii]